MTLKNKIAMIYGVAGTVGSAVAQKADVARHFRHMKPLVQLVESIWGIIRRLGPYLILEMILPGGTLMALLLFFYRSYRRQEVRGASDVAPATPFGFSAAFKRKGIADPGCTRRDSFSQPQTS
jgi:hypothetical protein